MNRVDIQDKLYQYIYEAGYMKFGFQGNTEYLEESDVEKLIDFMESQGMLISKPSTAAGASK